MLRYDVLKCDVCDSICDTLSDEIRDAMFWQFSLPEAWRCGRRCGRRCSRWPVLPKKSRRTSPPSLPRCRHPPPSLTSSSASPSTAATCLSPFRPNTPEVWPEMVKSRHFRNASRQRNWRRRLQATNKGLKRHDEDLGFKPSQVLIIYSHKEATLAKKQHNSTVKGAVDVVLGSIPANI